MDFQDLVRRNPLFEEWPDDSGHSLSFGGREVDALSGINEGCPVIELCIFRGVSIFIESVPGSVRAAITGTGRTVTPGAAEGDKFRAIRSTGTSEGTLTIGGALQRETAFMRQDSVEFNLLAYSRLVFANGLGNGSLGRAIDNAGKDNTAFIEGKMEKSVIITHEKSLPFRQLSSIRIVRLNSA